MGDAKKRRQSSEKSISVLTNGDLRQKASGGKVAKKRNDRKNMSFRDVGEMEWKLFILHVFHASDCSRDLGNKNN